MLGTERLVPARGLYGLNDVGLKWVTSGKVDKFWHFSVSGASNGKCTRGIHVLSWMCFQVARYNNFIGCSWVVVEQTKVVLIQSRSNWLCAGQLILNFSLGKVFINRLLVTFKWSGVCGSGCDRNPLFLFTEINQLKGFAVAYFWYFWLFGYLFTRETFDIRYCFGNGVLRDFSFGCISWLGLAYKTVLKLIFLNFLHFGLGMLRHFLGW